MPESAKQPCDGRAGAATKRAFASLPRPGRRLSVLTSSALALPGIAGSASADAPIERAQGSAAFSHYKEDNLSVNKFSPSTGSRSRYDVNTLQLRFDVPTTERTDVGVQFLYEKMSGASPWYVAAGTAGEPLQVMSGATITDTRYDLTIDTDYFLPSGKDTFTWGFSKEDDYFSTHGSVGGERNYNDKNTTLSVSGAFSYDWIETSDPDFSQARIAKGEKWSVDLFAGLSQILTRSTTGQINLLYKHSQGYLSDPYKAIQDFGGTTGILSDVRPDKKDQISIQARLRQHIEPLNASIHLDYRFYADTYKITSHTIELAWYQTLFNVVRITPAVRYYSQSKAEFYDTLLPIGVVPKERSSDFRLSPYGAISLRLKGEVELKDLFGVFDLVAALSYERYLSDGNFALVSVGEREEAPGLVKFQVFAATLTGRF